MLFDRPGADVKPLRDLGERLAAGGVAWSARFDWNECGARSLDALLAGVEAR